MKKPINKLFCMILAIMLAVVLFGSCTSEHEPENMAAEIQRVESEESESENEVNETSQETEDLHEEIRMEDHKEDTASLADNIVKTPDQARFNTVAAVKPSSENVPKQKETAVTPTPTPIPQLTVSPTAKPTPLPESESTAAPKPTAVPTTKPTVSPAPTIKPKARPSPTPTAIPTVKPTPAVISTPTPKTERVWVVDVPGHYETVEETKEVWVNEEGHWEETGYWASDWVYQCNQCGVQYPTLDAVNQHLDDSFDWDTMTGHSSYTQVSGPMYWVETEPVWVVDVPGHYETEKESKEVWTEEQGHWE